MRLDDLFPHLPKKEIAASGAIETTGVSVNSRKIRSGDLFVAIRGSPLTGMTILMMPSPMARVPWWQKAMSAKNRFR